MQRIILTYGVIAGFVVAIAFTAIFVAVKRHRDDHKGGVIRFLPALGMGAAIALIASLFYVVAWEAVLAINGGDFIAEMSARMLEERRAAGATAGELASLQSQMAQMQDLYANPLFRVLITLTEILPIGLLVALVSAALLCNPRFLPAQRTA
ncbi:MAG: hypothetical protein B7Y97_13350 [Sphingomonas sp. 32-66-10]|nr:MAG: hypothetical protein B7Y97_13350 [Sphingomonas sp. 32-66-10]